MKVLYFAAGIFLVSVWLVPSATKARNPTEDTTMLIVPTDMVDKILKEMPIESMNVYSDRFYPTMIQKINHKLYSRRARARTLPVEKRIRNIKLNQYLNIPNDRQGVDAKLSSYAYLAKNESTSFVIYTIPGEKGGKQIIDFNSKDVACIFGMSEERTAVKAKRCRQDVPNMSWDLIPNKYGDFWLLPCDRFNPYLIWEIQDYVFYFKK